MSSLPFVFTPPLIPCVSRLCSMFGLHGQIRLSLQVTAQKDSCNMSPPGVADAQIHTFFLLSLWIGTEIVWNISLPRSLMITLPDNACFARENDLTLFRGVFVLFQPLESLVLLENGEVYFSSLKFCVRRAVEILYFMNSADIFIWYDKL